MHAYKLMCPNTKLTGGSYRIFRYLLWSCTYVNTRVTPLCTIPSPPPRHSFDLQQYWRAAVTLDWWGGFAAYAGCKKHEPPPPTIRRAGARAAEGCPCAHLVT